MVMQKTSLLFVAFTILLLQTHCAEEKKQRNGSLNSEKCFNELIDSMVSVYGSKEPREFLETTLDHIMTLVQKRNVLPRFSKVVSSIADVMIDEDQTDLLLSELEVVHHILTNREDHILFKDSVDLVHLVMTDPQVVELAERALILANELSKDEPLKRQVGRYVVGLFKKHAMQRMLGGVNGAIKALDQIISNDATSERVIQALHKVSNRSALQTLRKRVPRPSRQFNLGTILGGPK